MMKYMIIAILSCIFTMFSFSTLYAQNPDSQIVKQTGGNAGYEGKKKWRLIGGAGYAYRLGKKYDHGDAMQNEFVEKLRHGFGVNLSASYFFKKKWGVGLHSDYVHQRERLPVDENWFKYVETNDYIYLGPTIAFKHEGANINLFIDSGIGTQLLVSRYTMSGTGHRTADYMTRFAFASYTGISAYRDFSSKYSAGVKLAVSGGSIREEIQGEKLLVSLTNLTVSGIIVFKN